MDMIFLTIKQMRIDSFEYPLVLLMLFLLPAVGIYVYLHPEFSARSLLFPSLPTKSSHSATKLPYSQYVTSWGWIRQSKRFWAAIVALFFFCAGFVMITISMAHPYGGSTYESRSEGIDIYFVLDMSASMKAYDFSVEEMQTRYRNDIETPNRFDVARTTMMKFIEDREKRCHEPAVMARCDRIGVALFGQSAFIDVPMTTNYDLLQAHIAKRRIDDIDATQSAIGDGILRAVASLRHSAAKTRSIILVTDGDRKGGRIGIEQAIIGANAHGVKVFPILIGESDWAVLMEKNPDGYVSFHKAQFPVNFELLETIASQTGGIAYHASDILSFEERLDDIIDHLEPSVSSESRQQRQIDLTLNFAALGFLFLLLAYGIYMPVVRQYP